MVSRCSWYQSGSRFQYMWLLQVWRYYLLPSEEQRLPLVKNPMCQTFPRIGPYPLIMVKNPKNQNNTPSAACNYWRWGGSGGQENINAICILGLNIVNDKVRGWHCQLDKLQHLHHHCRAHGQFLESPIWISIRCSWFFGGGSFFSSSSDLFVSYIEPFSAGVDSDSIPGRKKKKRKIPGQPGCVTTCSPWGFIRTSRSPPRLIFKKCERKK